MRWMLIAVVLCLPAGEAAAQSWRLVGGSDRVQSYVDSGSLKAAGAFTSGRSLSVYREPLAGTGIWGASIRYSFDCRRRQFRTLEYTYFDQSGTAYQTEPSNTLHEVRTPAPGSIDQAIVEFACAPTAGQAVADPFADARSRFR